MGEGAENLLAAGFEAVIGKNNGPGAVNCRCGTSFEGLLDTFKAV